MKKIFLVGMMICLAMVANAQRSMDWYAYWGSNEAGSQIDPQRMVADKEGNVYEMVGAINGAASWTGKLVRFGYATFSDDDTSIKGREFHYFDSNNNGEDMLAQKPSSNRSWKCIHKVGASYIGFPHMYYPSNPEFLINFVEAMKNYGAN